MSKNFVPFLIVLVIILIGGLGVLFMLNQNNINSDELNVTNQAEPTSIISPSPQVNTATSTPTITPVILNKQTLESGLIIEDEKIGEGEEVKTGDTISIHY